MLEVREVENHSIIEQWSPHHDRSTFWEKRDDDFYIIELVGEWTGVWNEIGDHSGGGLVDDDYWQCVNHGVRTDW